MSRLGVYYSKVLKKDLLYRFNYNSVKDLNIIKNLKVQIIVKGGLAEVVDSLLLIEQLTGLKGAVKVKKVGYTGQGAEVWYIVSTILRRERVFVFLEYLVVVVFPNYLRYYGFIDKKVLKNSKVMMESFSFYFKDIDIFYNLKGNFLGYKQGISFYLNFDNKSKEEVYCLLDGFCIPVYYSRK